MPYAILYALGVVLGLVVMRDPWPTRLATALVWPLGPVAFVLVIALLLVVSAILWPVLILAAAALVALIVWAL